MHVLCAIGKQGGAEVVQRLLEVIGPQHDLYLLHVIDTGPRRTMEEFLHGPGRLNRSPQARREQPIEAAEGEAAKAITDEAGEAAKRVGFTIHTDIQQGKPEQIICRAAQAWDCQLIALQSSEGTQGRPQIGPESLGHTARFVIDHAPCDVLLLREPLETAS